MKICEKYAVHKNFGERITQKKENKSSDRRSSSQRI